MAAPTAEQLSAKLTAAAELAPVAECRVEDESGGCGAKFSILVISDKFEGVALLERHRLCQRVLAEELKGVHACSWKTLTVAQAEARRAAGTL